ncbi:MAG: exodeoxyribonuclease V subunit gamma [Myxococcales bacterium]|nr:MAG: exodeoxyribonuclease V subunit gamma [Myxococcales bacterium]
MELIRSNRTENLADALASLVRDRPLGPFEKEAIVVQSRGMERWLTLALAERLGIWSNPSFPFAQSAIEQILDDLAGGASEDANAYSPGRLKWTIAELLCESVPTELETYLGSPSDADRVLGLSTTVSKVFERYIVHRPDFLKRWAQGQGTGWQAELWRRVVRKLGPHDLATRIQDALEALHSRREVADVRFRRLHLFSLETLPPLFLRFFGVLSREIPTTLYLLEPSSEYIGDVQLTARAAHRVGAPCDGHTFLSNLGRLSRDFQQLLLSVDENVQRSIDLFETPARRNLLSSLQADIREFRIAPEDADRDAIDPTDQSISIHACAGPMREAQVLHDLVRAALEDDHSLEPEDIVVMTPDLETYAPAFRAVFGQDEAHRIPYEVHDRKTRDDTSFYDDFLAALEVLDSRFSVLDVARLMDASSMRGDFRFTPDERARVTELLAAAGVRWGVDAEHREELEFPAEALHTWRAGLGRLFLGFASMPEATRAFEGLLPRGAPTLGDAELVARLSRLCEVLFDFHQHTRLPLDVGAWVPFLERLARLLFEEDDESSAAVRSLREALYGLRELTALSGYTGLISLKTLRKELSAQLLEKTPAVGFLRRGVTLTELVPLRSIPFRVVCLVGMSEDSFPRADDRPSFDLTRTQHRPGDRNKRYDDRHSFLQALLCARDRVIITYSAPPISPRTGANPSPVVWDLCETINRYYQLPKGKSVLEATTHPFHAFDPKYFEDRGLPQSFSRRYLTIARALAAPSEEPSRVELRAEAEDPEMTVSVGELARWLWNPATAFIDEVLRARFDRSELYEPTSALTEIGPLAASVIGNGALRAGLRGNALEEYLSAAPEFPDGNRGALQRQALAQEIRAVNARKAELEIDPGAASMLLSTQVGDFVLEGRLDGLYPKHRVLKRFTKVGGRAELAVWIEHLLMQTAASSALPHETHLVLRKTQTRASLVSFAQVNEPRTVLEALLTTYRRCQEAPLPLFEKSSRAFAERYAGDDTTRAIKAAKNELSKQRRWDSRLEYVLGPDDPFQDPEWSEAFQRTALTVYQPLFAHRSER